MAITITSTTPVEVGLHHEVIRLSEEFWYDKPTFPKDLRYLGQVLTIATITKDRMMVHDNDTFVTFIGTVYLPYLRRERKNDPMSPSALWKHNKYPDVRPSISPSPAALVSDKLLKCHHKSSFDVVFRASLMEHCQFVLELLKKEPPEMSETVLPIEIPNLEFELLLADRALEAKSREAGASK